MTVHAISSLIDFVLCPNCQGNLKHASKDQVAVCPVCRLCFPILHDLTLDLRLDHAVLLNDQGRRIAAKSHHATLTPLHGPIAAQAAGTFSLAKGHCILMARKSAAHVFEDDHGLIDIDALLNDNEKHMLSRYMASHTTLGKRVLDGAHIFGFRRNPDVMIPDPSLSKAHCLFFFDEHTLGVFDLFSRNGTYVNGKQVEFQLLSHGDIVQFGQSAIEVVLPA